MNELKIAQVAPLYESVPPKLYGGTERVVSFLTEELVAQGHDVTLFASGDSKTTARLIPIGNESLRLNKNCQDQLVHHVGMLQRVIDESHQFDIIHFHIDYLHFPLSRLLRLPHVTTLHGRLNIPDLRPFYDLYKDMPVISISHAQRRPLPDVRWVANVYHGITTDLFQPRYSQGKYLAFLGRVSPEKGLNRAIDIAVASGLPLKIAAKIDVSDRDFFERQIRKRLSHPLIEFIGEISESQKNEFLGNAIALLFPIDWEEPFGLVLIEALACGTPVVAWNRGSVPELIRSGRTGYIVKSEYEAVQAIHAIGAIDRKACRRTFEEQFTASRMASDYVAAYNRILESEKGILNLKVS